MGFDLNTYCSQIGAIAQLGSDSKWNCQPSRGAATPINFNDVALQQYGSGWEAFQSNVNDPYSWNARLMAPVNTTPATPINPSTPNPNGDTKNPSPVVPIGTGGIKVPPVGGGTPIITGGGNTPIATGSNLTQMFQENKTLIVGGILVFGAFMLLKGK